MARPAKRGMASGPPKPPAKKPAAKPSAPVVDETPPAPPEDEQPPADPPADDALEQQGQDDVADEEEIEDVADEEDTPLAGEDDGFALDLPGDCPTIRVGMGVLYHSTRRHAGLINKVGAPAIVTAVHNGKVSLTVFQEGKILYVKRVDRKPSADEYYSIPR